MKLVCTCPRALLHSHACALVHCWSDAHSARRPPPPPLPLAALNMAIFLLIGRTSALTMNVAGVVKDWMLILLSVLLFGCAGSPLRPSLPSRPLVASCQHARTAQ
jgi:hypothetical protein